jgi:hypothetical protein
LCALFFLKEERVSFTNELGKFLEHQRTPHTNVFGK